MVLLVFDYIYLGFRWFFDENYNIFFLIRRVSFYFYNFDRYSFGILIKIVSFIFIFIVFVSNFFSTVFYNLILCIAYVIISVLFYFRKLMFVCFSFLMFGRSGDLYVQLSMGIRNGYVSMGILLVSERRM